MKKVKAALKPSSKELIAVGKAIADEVRRAEAKAVAENATRWMSNILIELLSNQIGPCFSPKTRDQTQLVIRELTKLRDLIAGKQS